MTEGWVRTKRFTNQEIDDLVSDMKIAAYNKEKWIKLARLFKKEGMFVNAEMAYVGARYCDLDCRELMREWLALYTLNRREFKSKEEILENANLVNEGMAEVMVDIKRLLHELQHLLWMLENTGEQ